MFNPPSFLFNVKAFRLLTGHQTAPAVLPKDIAKALGPIANRNLYYKDAPAEIREAVWERFRLARARARAARAPGARPLAATPPARRHGAAGQERARARSRA